MEKEYELVLKQEQVKGLLLYLEDVPFKYASPMVELIKTNIKEVEIDSPITAKKAED
jgi:hypothetical protein